MSNLSYSQWYTLRRVRGTVSKAAVSRNQLSTEVDDGSIRAKELERAARKLNEVFSILTLDEQVHGEL